MKEIDKRPKKGLWAPGDYFGKCSICGETFIGDKRASHCANCAYKEPDMKDWIRIEDRLPDCICCCLIFYCEYWNHEKTWKIGWAFYNSSGEWCIDNSKVTPTHWMPLPEAPQH